jgi:hypothetical protein
LAMPVRVEILERWILSIALRAAALGRRTPRSHSATTFVVIEYLEELLEGDDVERWWQHIGEVDPLVQDSLVVRYEVAATVLGAHRKYVCPAWRCLEAPARPGGAPGALAL